MELPGPLAVLRRVLANPALLRVLIAYFAFHVAEFATWVTILLYAYEQTGPASVGVVALLQLVPAALVAAPAATLGDRYPRERVLILGYLVQAGAMVATAITMLAAAPVAIVYAMAALTASSLVVTRPTQSALMPALARTPNELTAANGAAGVVEGAGILVGPLIAAAILSQSSAAAVFLAAGAALVVATAATIGLHPTGGLAALAAPPGSGSDGETGAGERAIGDPSFLAGLRVVAADGDARLLVGLLTARTLVIGSADVLFVLMALDLLETGEPGAGILNAALGAGTIVGGAMTFALIGREGLAMVAALGAIGWAVAISLIAVTAAPMLAPLLIIAGGAGLAVVDVAGRTLLQRSVRDDVLSRVFGLQEGLAMGALAVGSILASALTEAIGLTLAIVGVGLILPALVVISWTRIMAMDRRAVVPAQAIALLRGTRLFSPMSAPQLESIARHATWVTVPTDTVLIREGEPGDRYYVLSSGTVRVEVGGTFRRDISRPGDGFGEIALLRDVARTATVTAASDVAVLAIDRAPFLAAVTGHPDAFAAADREVAGRPRSHPA